jgi:hypothetical protein
MPIPFHAEVPFGDCSTGVTFTLYIAGTATAFNIAATDQILITDINIYTGTTTLIITVFDGSATDDATLEAGEQIFKWTALSGGNGLSVSAMFRTPHYCKKGTYPRLLSSGAQSASAILHGLIVS